MVLLGNHCSKSPTLTRWDNNHWQALPHKRPWKGTCGIDKLLPAGRIRGRGQRGRRPAHNMYHHPPRKLCAGIQLVWEVRMPRKYPLRPTWHQQEDGPETTPMVTWYYSLRLQVTGQIVILRSIPLHASAQKMKIEKTLYISTKHCYQF